MSGLEAFVLPVVTRAVGQTLFLSSTRDFIFKWKLDNSELDTLRMQVNGAKGLLSVAESRQIEDISVVDEWIAEQRFTIFEAEVLMDKFMREVNKSEFKLGDPPKTSNGFKEKLRYKGKDAVRRILPCKKTWDVQMTEIINRLQSLAAQKGSLVLDNDTFLTTYRHDRRILSTSSANDSSEICGRLEDKEKIMKLLDSRNGNDDALRVIPIVGTGGIGKTTLASMVFHQCKCSSPSLKLPSWIPHFAHFEDYESSNHPVFEIKGWVCLSDEFKVTDAIKSLLASLSEENSKSSDDLESLQRELRKKLQGKKYLLILDDNWSTDSQKWNALSGPFSAGAPGSRIIVTTRSKDVARLVSTSRDCFYELLEMSKEDSWSLFESALKYVGESVQFPSQAFLEIGKEIVRMCKGVPLAILITGGLLRSKGMVEQEWNKVLHSKIWNFTKNGILPSLWLSYYHLPLPIRQCFAYLSIFPKDYPFSEEEVTLLWVAEGLSNESNVNEQYEDVAIQYFTHLLAHSFIQQSSTHKSRFVLHDLLHDLAEYVSRGVCVNLKDVKVQSRRLSYMENRDEVMLNTLQVRKLKHVCTFLPLRNHQHDLVSDVYFNSELLGHLLSNFKLLRVLSLKGYAISVLPDSVFDMKLLRYLDLSRTIIEYLPEKISSLYNLQILLLSECKKLRGLPAKICDLVNLRYLHIEGNDFEEIPDGFGRLKNLRSLPKYVLGKYKSKQLREFKELVNLHGKLHFSGLGNVNDKADVLNANFGNKESLEELILDWKSNQRRDSSLDEEVLGSIAPHMNLQRLSIKFYGGLRLSDWIVGTAPSFTKLVYLSINNCLSCVALPSIGSLPYLRELLIEKLPCITSLDDAFYGQSNKPFPVLEKLVINEMHELNTWCFPRGNNIELFCSLKELKIEHCPELMDLLYLFPCLIRLSIVRCKNLRGLRMSEELVLSKKFGHSLEYIEIRHCPELQEIPESFVNLVSVQVSECPIFLWLSRLQRVYKMSYVGASLQGAPVQDWTLEQVLEELWITTSQYKWWKINDLTSLKWLHLYITDPEQTSTVSEDDEVIRLPPNVSELSISGSIFHIHAEIQAQLSNLIYLTRLSLIGCHALESFPDIELPSTLKYLTIDGCNAIRTIPDRFISGCSSLEEMDIFSGSNLICLPPNLSTLQRLTICFCPLIRHFPTNLTYLKYLFLYDCQALETLPDSFHYITCLRSLHIELCPNLVLPEDGFPVEIRDLSLIDCPMLKSVTKMKLPRLTSLVYLKLEGFPNTFTLDHCLPESIQHLTISDFRHLKSLSGVVPTLKRLTRLCVTKCPLVSQKLIP